MMLKKIETNNKLKKPMNPNYLAELEEYIR